MGQSFSGFSVDASNNLNVNLNANSFGTITVTGTVTANQGGAPWSVVGNVASGATDSGDPLKTGGVFNTTQPTVTNGQRVDHQSTARGAVIVATGADTFTVAVSGTPAVNLAQLNGVALGSPSNFGTSPGAVSVQGVNASMFAGTTALSATGSSLNVNITGGGSGGTQYTNGSAVASGSLLGTEALGYDGANVRAITTDTLGNQTTRPGIPTTMLSTPVVINVNSTGNNFIIAGSAGKKIYVYAMDLQVSAITGGTPTTLTLKDGTTTALTGPFAFLNGATYTKDFCGEPWFVCSTTGASSGFNLNQSGTAQLSGTIWYQQV